MATTNKIIEMRKAVKAELETIFSHVYYGAADDTTAFPYAIFTIEEVSMIDGVCGCELEINAVDYGRNTATIEQKTADAVKAFDHKYFENQSIAYISYFDRKNNVASEDLNIIRRRIVFSVNLYEKE